MKNIIWSAGVSRQLLWDDAEACRSFHHAKWVAPRDFRRFSTLPGLPYRGRAILSLLREFLFITHASCRGCAGRDKIRRHWMHYVSTANLCAFNWLVALATFSSSIRRLHFSSLLPCQLPAHSMRASILCISIIGDAHHDRAENEWYTGTVPWVSPQSKSEKPTFRRKDGSHFFSASHKASAKNAADIADSTNYSIYRRRLLTNSTNISARARQQMPLFSYCFRLNFYAPGHTEMWKDRRRMEGYHYRPLLIYYCRQATMRLRDAALMPGYLSYEPLLPCAAYYSAISRLMIGAAYD